MEIHVIPDLQDMTERMRLVRTFPWCTSRGVSSRRGCRSRGKTDRPPECVEVWALAHSRNSTRCHQSKNGCLEKNIIVDISKNLFWIWLPLRTAEYETDWRDINKSDTVTDFSWTLCDLASGNTKVDIRANYCTFFFKSFIDESEYGHNWPPGGIVLSHQHHFESVVQIL